MNYKDELYHHGIKGQKWYRRRFQNPDGSLTPAGRRRYLNPDGSLTGKGYEEARRLQKEYAKSRTQYNELTGKRVSTRVSTSSQRKVEPEKKEVKDPRTMTKQELDAAVEWQRSYNNYQNMFNPQEAKKASVGRRFVETAWDSVLKPSLINAGQKAFEQKLNQEFSKRLKIKTNDGEKKDKKKDKKN